VGVGVGVGVCVSVCKWMVRSVLCILGVEVGVGVLCVYVCVGGWVGVFCVYILWCACRGLGV